MAKESHREIDFISQDEGEAGNRIGSVSSGVCCDRTATRLSGENAIRQGLGWISTRRRLLDGGSDEGGLGSQVYSIRDYISQGG